MLATLSTGERVEFSIHAIERAVERMLPAHTPDTAWGQIEKIAAAIGQISIKPPDWAPWRRDQSYLLIGDDVVLALVSVDEGVFCATTALVRGQNDHMHGRRRDRARRNMSMRRETAER